MAEVVATFAAISSFLQAIDFSAKFAEHLKDLLKGNKIALDFLQALRHTSNTSSRASFLDSRFPDSNTHL